MKKVIRVVLIILTFLTAAVCMTACSSVDSISIEDADMPKLIYVQGQELDLSGGSLTVVTGGKTEKIGLTASGVSVSGYDKNKSGEQTVTVTYKRKTTEFTVSVIAQLAAESYQADYFVGEEFNYNRGRLRVARDDGTLFMVSMSDSEVSVTGFDSSKAGTVTLTAEYLGKTGSFNVKVHEIGSLGITAPSKKAYYSHEVKGLILDGGFITLRSPDGTYSSNINLSDLPASSFTGFNLSAATENNMTKPLTQTVTVNYADKECKFDINIKYSDVSYIKNKATQYTNLDWSGNFPAIGDEQGKLAFNIAEKYVALSASDKEFITSDEIDAVVRAAAVYGLQAWNDAAAEYSDVFTFTSSGNINLVAKTPEATRIAYNKLSAADEPIISLGKILPEIAKNFSSVKLGNTTVASYLGGVYSDGFDSVIAAFDYMLKLHDKMATYVENGWKDDDIKGVIDYMIVYKHVAASDAVIYEIVAEKWNGVSGFFDMLLNYCYNKDDADTMNEIKGVYLPGKVGELYTNIVNAGVESVLMSHRMEYDATSFLIYYNRAVNLANELRALPNDNIQKWLFDNLDYNGNTLVALLNSWTMSAYGYFKICGNALFVSEVYDFLTEYLTVIEDYLAYSENNSSRYWSVQENAQKIINLWESFTNLAPTRQMEFLGVINTYYSDYGTPKYALNFSGGNAYTQFVYLVANCYYSVIGDNDAFDVFSDIMLATEQFARMNMDSDGKTVMATAMNSLESKINALTGGDLTKYNSYVKSAYELLKNRYECSTKTQPTSLGEWQETFDALANAIARAQFAYRIINQAAPHNYTYYAAFFSAYETAASLSKLILNSNNEAIINAYYYELYTINMLGYENAATVEWTLDYGLWAVRTIYASYQRNMNITVGSSGLRLIYLYDAAMSDILRKADPVMWWFVYSNFKNMPEVIVDNSLLIEAMTAYRNLEPIQKSLFSALEAGNNLYYNGILVACSKSLSKSSMPVAEQLLVAELYYTMYQRSPDGSDNQGVSYLSKFIAEAEKLKEDYEALEASEKTLFDNIFKDAYDYYVAESERLSADNAGSGESSPELAA